VRTYDDGLREVPAPVNISVKRLKFPLSGSARKSQQRFRDTPRFKFPAVFARVQPFQRSNERSEWGDHRVWLSGSHTNIRRSRYSVRTLWNFLLARISLCSCSFPLSSTHCDEKLGLSQVFEYRKLWYGTVPSPEVRTVVPGSSGSLCRVCFVSNSSPSCAQTPSLCSVSLVFVSSVSWKMILFHVQG
jgi:hypothetical protein